MLSEMEGVYLWVVGCCDFAFFTDENAIML